MSKVKTQHELCGEVLHCKLGGSQKAEVKSTAELQRLLDSVFLNAHCWLSAQPQVTWRSKHNVHSGRSLHELNDCLFPGRRLLEWMSSSVLIHNYRWLAVAEHIPLWHMTPAMKGLAIQFDLNSTISEWCLECFWPIYFHFNHFNCLHYAGGEKRSRARSSTSEALTHWLVFVLPLVAVSFSALSCTLCFILEGFLYWLFPSPRVSLSFRARLFIFWPLHSLYPSVLLLAFVSGAMSSEARQGGWDERFIWAHGAREEAEWELIRIFLSKAITLLLTFHLTFFFLNKSLLNWAKQGYRESAWPWLGVVMHCWF